MNLVSNAHAALHTAWDTHISEGLSEPFKAHLQSLVDALHAFDVYPYEEPHIVGLQYDMEESLTIHHTQVYDAFYMLDIELRAMQAEGH